MTTKYISYSFKEIFIKMTDFILGRISRFVGRPSVSEIVSTFPRSYDFNTRTAADLPSITTHFNFTAALNIIKNAWKSSRSPKLPHKDARTHKTNDQIPLFKFNEDL